MLHIALTKQNYIFGGGGRETLCMRQFFRVPIGKFLLFLHNQRVVIVVTNIRYGAVFVFAFVFKGRYAK